MPRKVALVGAGMGRFGTRPETPAELFAEAVDDAFASVDRGLKRRDVQEAWIGSVGMGGYQLGNFGPYCVQAAGLAGIPARRLENACASSGYAIRDAYLAIAAGACDVALAGGVEKMNDLTKTHQRYWLGVSGDTEWERLNGLTFPGVYALMARRHMHEHGTTEEDLAAVAEKNHANGALNPKAQFQKPVSREKIRASPYVCSPLRLFDCCSTTDGASVVLLASEERARTLTDAPVWILGSGAATDRLAAHERATMTSMAASRAAARDALAQARLSVDRLSFTEVHDCFTIAEIMATEDLGLCPPGRGGALAREGQTARDGRRPVNPSGGLKAKGHPLGATGAAQAVEVFHQLRASAGARQVKGATTALTHNVGGSGASCVVHVYGR